MDFDPAEFETFKASSAPAAGGFDPKEFESFKSGKKEKAAGPSMAEEPADHGLSERQKLSPVEKALSPITSYPETYQRMNKEARDMVSSGISQIANHDSLTDLQAHGASDIITGAVKAAAGTLGYVASPITAAYRSVAGQPVEDVTGIPREYTEFVAQLATPGIGLPKVGSAKPTAAPSAPMPRAPPENGIAAASQRLAENGTPVEVPRAIASDSMVEQRTGQAIRNMPIIGDAIPKATGRLSEQLDDAAAGVAAEYGGGSGPNVAHSIGQTIGSAAEREAIAAKVSAQQSDAAVLADWERNVQGANEAVAGVENNALARARQAVGNMSPQDMGETLIARLRQSEQEARATKDRLYGTLGESDASVRADSVQGVHNRVSTALDEVGRVVDPQLTPAASRMMDELRGFSELRIPNRVGAAAPNPADIAAVDARGMEQVRKRLSSMSQAASNDADRAASRLIMRQFDEWQGDAFENALFSGSPEALQAARDARASNASWRQRFHNDRDDADRIINKIVTGEVTPQEVSNYILGASKIGAKGVSSRLLTRLGEATGGDPEVMQAIRGGVWNRLSEATEGAAAKPGQKIVNDISEFLNGSGRDVANRLFTEPQRAIMRTYADALQRGTQARGAIAEVAANTKPSSMEVGIGPLQRLANDVLGKSGGRSDEALYAAINSYAKSGAKGDIDLLSRVLRAIPAKDRDNLAGAMIRDMGVSSRTGQFSPDVFVSSWNTYKPEAKSLLFGMSGPQRIALDDIAKISQRMKEVGSKFGNPSGTAQNVNFFALASAFIAAPLTTIAAGVGGAVVAKVLSSPVGAQSVAKWSRAYERAVGLPSAANQESLTRASSLLAINISRQNGAPVKDLMRQLQGPMPAGAQDEQR